MPPWLREARGALLLEVLVQPRASRTRLVGEHGDRLKIQLAAPPVDGEANQALLDFLAHELGLRRADLSIERGESGRRKTVRAAGADASRALSWAASARAG